MYLSSLGNFDATDIEIRYLTMQHCYIVDVLDGKLLITNDLENGRGIQVTTCKKKKNDSSMLQQHLIIKKRAISLTNKHWTMQNPLDFYDNKSRKFCGTTLPYLLGSFEAMGSQSGRALWPVGTCLCS